MLSDRCKVKDADNAKDDYSLSIRGLGLKLDSEPNQTFWTMQGHNEK